MALASSGSPLPWMLGATGAQVPPCGLKSVAAAPILEPQPLMG
ncbi:hypothetical protein [[Phormidium] sp. ETS-05]|nr:hypothetical protein [[Phormidium] sp. ETS-05]